MKSLHAIIIGLSNPEALELSATLYTLGVKTITMTSSLSDACRTIASEGVTGRRPVVFLDPGERGRAREFLERVMGSGDSSNVSTILVTSEPASRLLWAFRAGAIGLVSSPVDEIEMQRTLDRVIALNTRAS